MGNFSPLDDSPAEGCAPGELLQLYQFRDAFIPFPPHSGAWNIGCTQIGPVVQSKTGGKTRLIGTRLWMNDDGNLWHTDNGEVWFMIE